MPYNSPLLDVARLVSGLFSSPLIHTLAIIAFVVGGIGLVFCEDWNTKARSLLIATLSIGFSLFMGSFMVRLIGPFPLQEASEVTAPAVPIPVPAVPEAPFVMPWGVVGAIAGIALALAMGLVAMRFATRLYRRSIGTRSAQRACMIAQTEAAHAVFEAMCSPERQALCSAAISRFSLIPHVGLSAAGYDLATAEYRRVIADIAEARPGMAVNA